MKWGILLLILFIIGLLVVSGCDIGKPKCKTVTRTNKGCDQMAGCECLHKSWGGLGACDSCECTVCE